MQDLDAIAMSRKKRCVVMTTGEIAYFDNMFVNGEGPFVATSATAPLADGTWLSIDLTAFCDVLAQ